MLTRVFRWSNALGERVCGTIEDLTRRGKVNRGYLNRVLRLKPLAPDIVEAILDGTRARR